LQDPCASDHKTKRPMQRNVNANRAKALLKRQQRIRAGWI
jgi:hypothetical protein